MHEITADGNVWEFLGSVLLILALSGLIIPILQRLRIATALGYLLCGLLIGPHALGILAADYPWLHNFVITDKKLVAHLGELGIVFLLFIIGLELSFSRLWELRRYVLGLGSLQIIVTSLIIFLIALQFDNSLPVAILVGGAFALSSTAIVMELMTEQHMLSRPIGRICFSVLLMQDLAVVPILMLVSIFSGETEGSVLLFILKSLFLAGFVIAAMFVLGKLFLRPLLRMLSPAKNAEWLLAITLLLIIGAAMLTHFSGLSAALGAFLAGLLISETEYKHEIEVITEPVKGLLMGIFFLSVGMATDIAAIMAHPIWLALSIIGIFLIKAILFYPIARLFSIPKGQAIQASILLAQCGEFAFIVLSLALMGNLIPADDAHFFLLVVTVSLLLTPLTTKLAPLAQRLLCRNEEDRNLTHIPAATHAGEHIIIAGFGRVGQMMADILETQGIPYVAMDMSGTHVGRLRAEGYPVIYGNARHIDLWRKLNAENAKAAVVTIDEHTVTGAILRALHHHWPTLPVILRVKDTKGLEDYYAQGANAVVPETLESTLQLVRTLLEYSGIPEKEAHAIIAQYRRETMIGETAGTF